MADRVTPRIRRSLAVSYYPTLCADVGTSAGARHTVLPSAAVAVAAFHKPYGARVTDLTGRSHCHAAVQGVIADLNPVLRGWGNRFRTGNAAGELIEVDPTRGSG